MCQCIFRSEPTTYGLTLTALAYMLRCVLERHFLRVSPEFTEPINALLEFHAKRQTRINTVSNLMIGTLMARSWSLDSMSKPAEVIIETSATDSLPDEGVDGDKLFMRQLKEEEIRAKLDAFAKELAQVKSTRDEH